MIKNGRPYTCESKHPDVDDGLLTSPGRFTNEQIDIISKWIQSTFEHSDEIFPTTSYEMKHWLQNKHGIYMTDNEFKDAMFLAGFKPVNPNEFNWRYRVSVHHDAIINPFIEWLKPEDTSFRSPAEIKFMKFILDHPDMPVFADHDIIKNYLESQPHCDSEILYCLEWEWNMFVALK